MNRVRSSSSAAGAALSGGDYLLSMWIAARPFSENFLVVADVTFQVLYEWGEKCVNPEYEHLEGLIEPKSKAPAK